MTLARYLGAPPEQVYSGNWHGGSSFSWQLPVSPDSSLIGFGAVTPDYEIYPGAGGNHVSGPSWGGPLPLMPSGLAALADFPRFRGLDGRVLRGRGLEDALTATKPAAAPAPGQALKAVVGVAEAGSPAAKAAVVSRLKTQEGKLRALASDRAAVAHKAAANFNVLAREVKALDRKGTMAATQASQKRATEALRWKKLEGVAALMSQNAATQANLARAIVGTVQEGKPELAAQLGKAFNEVGLMTGRLRDIRKGQVRLWSKNTAGAKLARLSGRKDRAEQAKAMAPDEATRARAAATSQKVGEAMERARSSMMRSSGSSMPAEVSIDWEAGFERRAAAGYLMELEGFGDLASLGSVWSWLETAASDVGRAVGDAAQAACGVVGTAAGGAVLTAAGTAAGGPVGGGAAAATAAACALINPPKKPAGGAQPAPTGGGTAPAPAPTSGGLPGYVLPVAAAGGAALLLLLLL